MSETLRPDCLPERVTGYVDGALPPDERPLIEAHLASCPACARQAAEERELRERLAALPPPELPTSLEPAVRRRLRAERRTPMRWALPLAAILVIVFLWGRNWAPFIALELARDHRSCFSRERVPALVLSNDPDEVQAWFHQQGAPIPDLPASAGGLELVGARRCPLLDRQVAHLYYVSNAGRLSLFVVPGSVRFGTSYATTALGRRVRLVRVGGEIVGIAGDDRSHVDAFARALQTSVALLRPAS
jgi:anti-sigma factor RsiW